MSDLHTDVRYIKGIGEARAKALAKLGITDLLSLISYFPRDWEDRSAHAAHRRKLLRTGHGGIIAGGFPCAQRTGFAEGEGGRQYLRALSHLF